jgi:hypothetical protein
MECLRKLKECDLIFSSAPKKYEKVIIRRNNENLVAVLLLLFLHLKIHGWSGKRPKKSISRQN